MRNCRPALLTLILTAAVATATFCLYLVYLPATLRNMEAVGFFAWLPDFLQATLQKPAGAGLLLTAWLEQFFYRAWAGAAIAVALQGICAGATYSLLSKTGSVRLAGFYTLFIYIGLAVFVGPSVRLLLAAAWVLVGLAVFLRLHRPWPRRLWLLLLPVGYAFVPFPYLMLLGAALTAVEALYFRCRPNAGLGGALTLLLLAVPPIWSTQVAFVPPARYYTGYEGALLPGLLYALGLSVVFLLVPRRNASGGSLMRRAGYAIACLIGAGIGVHGMRDVSTVQAEEKLYALEQAADEADWNRVLRLATTDHIAQEPYSLRYALLAEAAQGTLPEHLFRYPINSPEQFVFRHTFALPACYFNYLFYKHLGYPDEAMHQAFENGVLSPGGTSRRSLRHLTDAALDAGDTLLARKYMAVLERTSHPGNWLSERRKRLQTLSRSARSAAPAPLRSRNFVGAIRLDAEWVYALQQDSTNTKLLDYLLCSFLLQKRPEKFARLMTLNPHYAGRPLPAPYAQALALFADERLQWDERFQLPPATVQEWRRCLRLQQEGKMDELARRCTGTYWYYLFFADLPAQDQQQGNIIQ